MLAQEEYFEHIATRSAYYDLNKKNSKKQQYVHNVDITLYNNVISDNEYHNGMSTNILIIFAPPILWLIICYINLCINIYLSFLQIMIIEAITIN